MKQIVVLVAVAFLVTGSALADGFPLNPPKWVQPPAQDITVLGSQILPTGQPLYLAADDFFNEDDFAINGLTWWGGYYNLDGQEPFLKGNDLFFKDEPLEQGFILQFWTNRPADGEKPYSRPAKLMATRFVEFANADLKKELYDSTTNLYQYMGAFEPVEKYWDGELQETMWVSIQAMMPFPPQWGWQKTNVPWEDSATYRIGNEDQWHKWEFDLAFAVHNVPGPGTLAILLGACYLPASRRRRR